MSEHEIKSFTRRTELKAIDDATGTFSGYGSVFDDPHPTSSWSLPSDWLDVVRPGAFKRTLADHKSRGTRPAMCLQHAAWSNPVGVWRELKEDDHGLLGDGQLAIKTPRGSEVYELMKIGALDGLSIGFYPVTFKLDEKKKTRELLDIELIEISPVTIPGNGSARVVDVKSVAAARNIRHLEKALCDAGLSRTEAKAILADGFKALALRDAAANDALVSSLKRLAATIHS